MDEQIIRTTEANLIFTDEEAKQYIASPDEVPYKSDESIPKGYKRCGGCKRVIKLYLFNRSSGSRLNCTGNCKACQKKASKKSYEKTKHKQDHKQYYQEHKEERRERARKYYQEHKDELNKKHAKYRNSAKGQKAMKKAHDKRKTSLKNNQGVPYTRDLIMDREKLGGEYPVCYLCNKPITVDSNLHLEHVVPIALGGMDCFTNVACAHQLCNLQKTKDAREISADQVEDIIRRAEQYIDEHPDSFEIASPIS